MRYAWLGGLALGALPMTAPASHADVRVNVGLPFIGIGFGHHHHDFVRPFYGPVFYGGYCGPRVVIGPSYYCPPAVVYAAPPAVVYATPPVYAPQTYAAPAPQYYQAPAPADAPVPVPQPVPQSATTYYYGR